MFLLYILASTATYGGCVSQERSKVENFKFRTATVGDRKVAILSMKNDHERGQSILVPDAEGGVHDVSNLLRNHGTSFLPLQLDQYPFLNTSINYSDSIRHFPLSRYNTRYVQKEIPYNKFQTEDLLYNAFSRKSSQSFSEPTFQAYVYDRGYNYNNKAVDSSNYNYRVINDDSKSFNDKKIAAIQTLDNEDIRITNYDIGYQTPDVRNRDKSNNNREKRKNKELRREMRKRRRKNRRQKLRKILKKNKKKNKTNEGPRKIMLGEEACQYVTLRRCLKKVRRKFKKIFEDFQHPDDRTCDQRTIFLDCVERKRNKRSCGENFIARGDLPALRSVIRKLFWTQSSCLINETFRKR